MHTLTYALRTHRISGYHLTFLSLQLCYFCFLIAQLLQCCCCTSFYVKKLLNFFARLFALFSSFYSFVYNVLFYCPDFILRCFLVLHFWTIKLSCYWCLVVLLFISDSLVVLLLMFSCPITDV